MQVREDGGEHILMDKQKAMGSCVEGIGNFGLLSLLIDDTIDHVNDLFGEVIKIKDWWISV